jgi:PIN domain nuclease of toxin-antitoxin system
VILDTCALLWLSQGGGVLSKSAREQINAAPAVYVSAITGFEVGIKHQRGKLVLPAPPGEWFAAVLAHHDIQKLPLDLATCLRATELPPIHGDPCDRMSIATAELHHLPVVTADPVFAQYGVTVFS